MSKEQARPTYGFTPEDPILCNFIQGEQQFIVSLRCPKGHHMSGARRGSALGKCTDPENHKDFSSLLKKFDPQNQGEDQYIVDIYELVCDGGEYKCTLYFDMYHANAADQPPPRGLSRVKSWKL